MKHITAPIADEAVDGLAVGDRIELSGFIFTGRDSALPKLVALIKSGELEKAGLDLRGGVVFHTAVSPAGVGPTSSNKLEIESSIPELSEAGIKLHLGKGALQESTVRALGERRSLYAVMPPVTALLQSKIKSVKIVAFPEEGMEALHLLEVDGFPAVIAAAHGESLYANAGGGNGK